MTTILALDLARVSGWALGEPGAEPVHGSHCFCASGASHEAGGVSRNEFCNSGLRSGETRQLSRFLCTRIFGELTRALLFRDGKPHFRRVYRWKLSFCFSLARGYRKDSWWESSIRRGILSGESLSPLAPLCRALGATRQRRRFMALDKS
jgi:hypothetical protein